MIMLALAVRPSVGWWGLGRTDVADVPGCVGLAVACALRVAD
jgi:hypothetical protein